MGEAARRRRLGLDQPQGGVAVAEREERAPLAWDDLDAGARANLERFDRFAVQRNRLRVMAAKVGEYAGLPMPIEGEELVIHPSYAFAEVLKPEKKKDDAPGYRVVNSWYSCEKRCDIVVIERDGKRDWGWRPAFHHLRFAMQTMGCAVAWGIEQESAALQTLAKLLSHHAFKTYLLTGMFLETSKRSGLIYLFRKLRPTVVLTPHRGAEVEVLCALCQHPIAYYAGSWAGAMCPTDDVIAHLMQMRADEPLFWRRSTQHPAHRPEAGL